MRIVGCVLAALFLVAQAARAADGPGVDWPHLRGPGGDAVSPEKGLVDTWPAQGPPILWQRNLGQGYSGLVVVDGRVYTQFQSSTGQFVAALDADTGEEVWRRRVDWPWQPGGAYPGPYATPTWYAGRLFYATPAGLAGCLDSRGGHLVWSVDVRKKFRGMGIGFGFSATPLVEAGRVILPVGGKGASVVALDAEDGRTVWTAGDDPASYCPAYPITLGGRRLIVAFLQNSLAAHDPATGKLLWRLELSQGYDEHSAWPLYAEPHLLLCAPFQKGAQLYRLDPADRPPRTVWASQELSNDVCSSVLVAGHVYGFDLHQAQASASRPSRGRFKCLDLLTGKLRWQTDRVGQATVLAADGKLILLNDTGTLILARASPTAYEELARCRVLTGGICWTPPTLSRGRLYVRNQQQVACVYLRPADTLDPDRPVAAPPSPLLDVDWSWLLGHEPDYPHDAPTVQEVARWFGWCLGGVFGAAALPAGLAWLAARAARRPLPRSWAVAVFALAAFVLGLVGTTVFSAWADTFVLTWPASLYVAFRVTLAVVVWAEAHPVNERPRLIPGAVTLAFVLLCWGYYQLCLAVGYVMAWAFLAGFLPAAPAAVVSARGRRWWLRLPAEAAAFTVYFWVCGLVPAWKSALFG
jgi:outer membrane protein assembly factor BamB